MNRKAKIVLTLTTITLILGSTAQYYTNHKIDRVLNSFPYHIKDQLTLHVAEKHKDFFQRELVFSLENDQQQKTDIISTNLTALPFTILAESHVPSALIRELNKKLNITIDKNNINSKFSVVGDYLQSDIVTQFRDLANKPQDLHISINYAAKTKAMEIQSQLSAFNYDAKTKFEGIAGQYVFIPTGEHHYDLTELDLTIKRADIYLLNGENTNIKLDKANYRFNKSLMEQHYDLETFVNVQNATISNKNKTSEKDQIELNEVTLTSTQQRIPNSLTIYHEWESFIEQNKTLPDAIDLLSQLLFNNDKVEAKLTVNALSVPLHSDSLQFITVQDAAFTLDSDNQERTHANTTATLKIKQLSQTGSENEKLNIQGLLASQKLNQFNLNARLKALPYYFGRWKKTVTPSTFPAKDDLAFIEVVKQLATNFEEQRESTLTIETLAYKTPLFATDISLNQLSLTHFDGWQDIKYGSTSSLAIKNIMLNTLGMQFNDVEYKIPLRLTTRANPSPLDLCYDNTYYHLCPFYLSEKSYKKWQNRFIKEAKPTIDNAQFKMDVDTIPHTQAYPVNIALTLGLTPQNSEIMMPSTVTVLPYWLPSDMDVKVTFAKGFAHNESHLAQLTPEKREAWQTLYDIIKPNAQLAPYFADEGEHYTFHLIQQNHVQIINGQPLEDVIKKLVSPAQLDDSSAPSATDSPPAAVDQEPPLNTP